MEYVWESGWCRSSEHGARVFIGLSSRVELPRAVKKRANSNDREYKEDRILVTFHCRRLLARFYGCEGAGAL